VIGRQRTGMRSGIYAAYFMLDSTVATCPKCGTNLGLRTSFALANVWNPRGISPFGFSPRLEFPCHRCGTSLTYRYKVAGLFAVLALLPLMILPVLPSLHAGNWAYLLWLFAFVVYWASLAAFFSRYARPIIADPPLESDS
jgi:hypothetical protein